MSYNFIQVELRAEQRYRFEGEYPHSNNFFAIHIPSSFFRFLLPYEFLIFIGTRASVLKKGDHLQLIYLRRL